MKKRGKHFSLLVETAMAIIDEEFMYLYGVEDVSDRLEVTKFHLIREFSSQVGITPGKYLRNARLAYAKKLLREEDYSIALIAGMCGFAESGYFCRVFKSRFGMTPGEYRRENS